MKNTLSGRLIGVHLSLGERLLLGTFALVRLAVHMRNLTWFV